MKAVILSTRSLINIFVDYRYKLFCLRRLGLTGKPPRAKYAIHLENLHFIPKGIIPKGIRICIHLKSYELFLSQLFHGHR